MSPPLRIPLDQLAAGLCALPAPLARYVSRVHRLAVGAHLLAFDPASGTEAEAQLVEGPGSEVWCRIAEPRPSGYRPLPIQLLQGLGKADKPDEVIRAATALGVASVRLLATARSVARLAPERGEGKLERYRRIAVEAARQSGRGDVPSLHAPEPLSSALEAVSARRRLLLAPDAPPLFERLQGAAASETLALLVGPEGGFDDAERRAALDAGFLPASLGSTTLRTELAGVAALGALVAWSALAPAAPTAS